MSYSFGTNGNDLNWDAVLELNSFVTEIEVAIFNGEAEFDEDGNLTDEFYEGVMDSNPNIIYYSGEEIDIQEMLRNGEKIDNKADWFIFHDTNGNHVTLVGEVPDEYLTDEFIAERKEMLGE